ncbi:ribosomal biogenesis protein LAS1L [Clinocottus analis]|uniref:ribosomal biogenesis protein LAS1L n=1 Tax=Clinocottus analis TaxID=304258 RepID=UPI0035C0197C
MKKSSEKRRHVVAWANKAEWDQVLDYLYSKDCALQRFALHRVSAWRARYANSSPVAVDCTADLVRCQVLDRAGQLDAEDLVLLYGAGLVRFVNLITERQQGRSARPLRRLAGNLNIPEWVVNLRHDVTHRKLPTLKWCRKGCAVVLEWLQQEYWSRQLGGGPNEDWDSESDGEDEEVDLKRHGDELVARQKEMEAYKIARELLISFEKEQYQASDRLPEDPWPAPFADMSWLLGEIKQFALQSSNLLIDVLLEDGFLVPTAEQLETLGCDATSAHGAAAEPRLAQAFLRFWLPLLKTLNSPSFIHLLLEKLFVELKLLTKEPNAHRAFYIAAWISEIIVCNSNKFEYHFETKGQKKARMKDRVFVNRIQLRWQQLLSACLDSPCVSTPRLLQLVLDDMEHPLPLETRQKLLQLCSIYTQDAPSASDASPQRRQQHIYTLESLHEKLQHSRRLAHPWRSAAEAERSESSQEYKWADGQAEKAKLLRGSPWQVCNDKVLWKNYPLGKVPGQSDDPSRLMVENYSTMTVFDQPVELESSTTHNVPGSLAAVRTADGLLWNHSDVNMLKSGLQLF